MFFPTIIICNIITSLCFTFVYRPTDPITLAKCERDIAGLAWSAVMEHAPTVDALSNAPLKVDFCCLPKDISKDTDFRGCPQTGQES